MCQSNLVPAGMGKVATKTAAVPLASFSAGCPASFSAHCPASFSAGCPARDTTWQPTRCFSGPRRPSVGHVNENHAKLMPSPEWAAHIQDEVLPLATAGVDLGTNLLE